MIMMAYMGTDSGATTVPVEIIKYNILHNYTGSNARQH